MQRKSIANELAQAMAENLKEKSGSPTTPDKIAEALDQLSSAAQLFDTTGNIKQANEVDRLIRRLSIKLANQGSAMPPEVARVLDFAKQSAALGSDGKPLPRRVSCRQEDDGRWVICDNYERESLILEFSKGYWSTRNMYSERPARRISQEEAEANAKLLFADARDDEFVEPNIQLKEKDPGEGLLDSEFDDRLTDEPSSPFDEYEQMEFDDRDYDGEEEPHDYLAETPPRWRL